MYVYIYIYIYMHVCVTLIRCHPMTTSTLLKCFQISVPYASGVKPTVCGRHVMSEAENIYAV